MGRKIVSHNKHKKEKQTKEKKIVEGQVNKTDIENKAKKLMLLLIQMVAT
jgi:hypothetical protein